MDKILVFFKQEIAVRIYIKIQLLVHTCSCLFKISTLSFSSYSFWHLYNKPVLSFKNDISIKLTMSVWLYSLTVLNMPHLVVIILNIIDLDASSLNTQWWQQLHTYCLYFLLEKNNINNSSIVLIFDLLFWCNLDLQFHQFLLIWLSYCNTTFC